MASHVGQRDEPSVDGEQLEHEHDLVRVVAVDAGQDGGEEQHHVGGPGSAARPGLDQGPRHRAQALHRHRELVRLRQRVEAGVEAEQERGEEDVGPDGGEGLEDAAGRLDVSLGNGEVHEGGQEGAAEGGDLGVGKPVTAGAGVVLVLVLLEKAGHHLLASDQLLLARTVLQFRYY